MLSSRPDPFDFPTNYHNTIGCSVSKCDPNSVNIGPTAVDFSMLSSASASEKEIELFKQWKKQDLSRFYSERRNNCY